MNKILVIQLNCIFHFKAHRHWFSSILSGHDKQGHAAKDSYTTCYKKNTPDSIIFIFITTICPYTNTIVYQVTLWYNNRSRDKTSTNYQKYRTYFILLFTFFKKLVLSKRWLWNRLLAKWTWCNQKQHCANNNLSHNSLSLSYNLARKTWLSLGSANTTFVSCRSSECLKFFIGPSSLSWRISCIQTWITKLRHLSYIVVTSSNSSYCKRSNCNKIKL